MRRTPALPWIIDRSPVPDEGRMWLTWLVRLRWLALFAQAVTLAFVFHLLDGVEPIAVWVGTMAVLAATNLWATSRLAVVDEVEPREAHDLRPATSDTGPAAARAGHYESSWQGSGAGRPVDRDSGTPTVGTILGHLLLDVFALTTFFLIGGGPENPFTPLYLVHVAMGAVILPPRRAGLVALAVLAGYSLLFAGHLPLHYEHHSLPAGLLVRLGQWLAFVITSLSVAVFVLGLAGSLRRNRQELLDARDRTARTDRLRSVGTLAAGAAHELNTPLATMALRLRRVRRRHADAATEADVDAIEDQLDRCVSIVERLLIGAGDPSASDITRRPLAMMVAEAVRMWSRGTTLEIRVADHSNGLEVELPDVAFQQALINLLENAREAQEAAGAVTPLELDVLAENGSGVIELADRGVGPPSNADQMGEPFFTTKATGTGLGVFVARAVADGVGGGLQYRPRDGAGLVARWWFPEARRAVGWASVPAAPESPEAAPTRADPIEPPILEPPRSP